jgi:mannose/fructose/N-acetylgalactosamine-specific phosphotransferase system component IID
MCGCLLWFIGLGVAIGLAIEGNWLGALVVFIGVQLLVAFLGPREEDWQ